MTGRAPLNDAKKNLMHKYVEEGCLAAHNSHSTVLEQKRHQELAETFRKPHRAKDHQNPSRYGKL